MTYLIVGGVALLGALVLSGVFALAASAASTITVNTTGDTTQAGDGACSLREATLYANGTTEPDCAAAPASGTTTIIVPAGLYILTGAPLRLTGNASISGAGAATTTINAGGMSQVLVVASGAAVSVSGVALTGGDSGSVCTAHDCVGAPQPVFGIPGGGVANAGTLTLTGVAVSGNRTGAGRVNDRCDPTAADGCRAGDGGDGGGISNTGTLTIAGSTISGNVTGTGGAGDAGGAASPGGASGSGGNGGGISNGATGTLTITSSTIAGNRTGAGADGARGGNGVPGAIGGAGSDGGAGGSGGGIDNNGQLVISRSTIAGNQTGSGGKGGAGGSAGTGPAGNHGGGGGAGGSGGAISSHTDMTISNSTIVGNAAATSGAPGVSGDGSTLAPTPPGNGGGIEQHAMGTTLTHVTIASNTAPGTGGGIDGDGGTVTAGNSIVASNLASAPNQNCAGVVTDQGGNVEFGASSCPAGFLRGDPKLGPLASNGGPTQTVALQPGSAAIHHVRTCVLSTDQRGVARPVGSACDSGAYEVAPPSVSGIGVSGVTTSSAVVAASANPNLQDASVVINFGPTTSYGSSTAPQDLGASNASAPFSAALTGLAPNTTYHFDVVATNADGRTTSSDGVFTTLPPLGASIVGVKTTGPALSLTIACAGGSGPGTCAGAIGLTAKDPSKHRHARKVTVAAGGYSVASGGSQTVTLKLNRKGRTMLSQHYTLASTVSLGGTTHVSRQVTFRYPVIKSPISYTWAFSPGSSRATELTVTRIPHGGRLLVICQGGGCPFATRRFKPRHGQVTLAPTFAHSPLRPGARLVLEVLAANRVGKVEIFAIRSSQPPVVSRACRPPGTSRPARCV